MPVGLLQDPATPGPHKSRLEGLYTYGGLGIAVMSTPQGVMSGQEAWRRKIGGEVLCYVW